MDMGNNNQSNANDDEKCQSKSVLLKRVKTQLTFLRFKRGSLNDIMGPGDKSFPTMKYAPHPDKDRARWTSNRNSLLFMVIIFSAFPLLMIFPDDPSLLIFPIGGVAISCWIGFSAWCQLKTACYQSIELLRDSDLLHRVLQKDEGLNEIFEYATEPFSLVFLGSKPTTVEEFLELVVFNLDWYLIEPKPLLRTNWVTETVALPVSFIIMIFSYFDAPAYPAPPDMALVFAISIALFLYSLVPSFLAARKREIFLETFIRYVGDEQI